MNFPVIVLGTGGHAKVAVDALIAGGVEVIGMADRDPAPAGSGVFGIPVIGTDDAVLAYAPDVVLLCCGVGSVGLPERRTILIERFESLGYRFAVLTHPSAVIGREVEIGDGAQIMAGAVIQSGARIGRHVIVNTRASVDHDCVIGDHVHLAPGVTLSGGVTVDAGSHVGTGASVIQGINIGKGCLIGAGAVVIRDVLDGEIVLGVPAKVVAR